ncbi:uncharacterized protein ZBIST_0693 [Zygosaccharomyces bailii]|nr:uncharacterized protein ZBIST_0693 [Zygosaccharomyces bailii]
MTLEKSFEGVVNELELTSEENSDNSASLSPQDVTSSNISLAEEISKIDSTSAGSQVEQLAGTNLLTVRFKCKDAQYEGAVLGLKAEVENLSRLYKGFVLSPDLIEPYEYWNDDRRLEILEEKKDVYLYERGTEEYARSADTQSESEGQEAEGQPGEQAGWDSKYDVVIQVQFQRPHALNVVRGKVQRLLKDREGKLIERWSISVNRRALTQPGNLYARGIPKKWSMEQIAPMFEKFGPISSLKIICDSKTGESLGYGFLSYPLGSQASNCIKELNGKIVDGSGFFINYHVERKERERIHRDSVKENNNHKDFKAVFVGNLPTHDEEGSLILPSDVVELFKANLRSQFGATTAVSSYFPKKNGVSNIEYKQEDGTSLKRTSTESDGDTLGKLEDSGLKNYGFIKFANHEQALVAINNFNNFEWHGKNLVVNKAIQKKAYRRGVGGGGVATNNNSGGSNHSTAIPSISSASKAGYQFFTPYAPTPGNPSNAAMGFFGDSYFSYMAGQTAVSSSLYGNMPSPIVTSPGLGAFENSNAGGSLMSMGSPPYGILNRNRPFGFPFPTRDQQESNLYVKHLPLSWKDEDLYEFYQQFGEIISAKIITVGGSKKKKESTGDVDEEGKSLGASRGYGFVCFKDPLDASGAILATDGYPLTDSHILHVSFAQKTTRPGFSGVTVKRPLMGNMPYNPKFLKAMREHQQREFLAGSGHWPLLPMISPPPSMALMPSAFPMHPVPDEGADEREAV